MKRLLSILLVFLMLFSTFALASCEKEKDEEEEEEEVELELEDVQELVVRYKEMVENREITSVRVSFEKELDGEKSTEEYAFDKEKNKTVLYLASDEVIHVGGKTEGRGSKQWYVLDGDGSPYIIEQDSFDGEEEEPSREDCEKADYDYEELLYDEIQDAMLACIDVDINLNECFEKAIQKGDTVEVKFSGVDGVKIDMTMIFEDGLVTYSELNMETPEDAPEKHSSSEKITYEYDININVPEVE